jgi:hypothetical protein
MSINLNKIVGPYYCQVALGLCMQARELCAMGECKKVAELCAVVSNMCEGNAFEVCGKESSLCRQVSKSCTEGRGSKGCLLAQDSCNRARRICAQNNLINGG